MILIEDYKYLPAVEGSTEAEDLFEQLFAELFGLERMHYLQNEYPFQDIYGDNRYIDYALKTGLERYAIEIDGETWHNPALVGVDKYLDDLMKRNSLTYHGWKLYIWTYRQLVNDPERVKSELAQFLGKNPHFIIPVDYLPRQHGTVLRLRPHQAETLETLHELRSEYNTMALVADAQGTGKTTTAVLDAKEMGLKTLFIAHTVELLKQAEARFKDLWPEVSTGILKYDEIPAPYISIASIQGIQNHLDKFRPDEFGYIIIDEAHHAAAPSYRRVISYFSPRFLLGLTATPERHDQDSIMEIFRNEAHRLDLKTAVEMGELVPIRCVRVKTNIDFSRVRINQIKYNYRDLDQTVHVPERNRLIVETYLSHVPNEKAVVFCASVAHAAEVAGLFRDGGVPAQVVEGRMKRDHREQVLQDYKNGLIRVLCACDILNEGWDSPETAVLLMARPTLSKVIYLQQLGRGTRRAPGKEALVVFDFVDQGQRHNQSLSLHRLLKAKHYRSGALVVAPPGQMEEERRRMQMGEKVETVLPHNIFARDYEIIDLFDWQEEIQNMMSMHELAMELYVDDQTLRNWVEADRIIPGPDLELPMGKIVHRYFQRERLDDIRAQLNIPARKPEQLKDDFFRYVEAANMSASYKPVMLRAMLSLADSKGQVELAALTAAFRDFYTDKAQQGLPIETPGAAMNRVTAMDDLEVARVMLTMPFEKFERKFFLEHRKDLNKVAFVPSLWRRLTVEDLQALARICTKQINDYYEKRVDK